MNVPIIPAIKETLDKAAYVLNVIPVEIVDDIEFPKSTTVIPLDEITTVVVIVIFNPHSIRKR